MKCEAMTGFKQTWPNSSMWSTESKYKIRICVTFEQYDALLKLKGQKDISYTLKKADGGFLTGFFSLDSIRGISGFNCGRIVELHLSDLDCERPSKDFIREIILNDILDERN